MAVTATPPTSAAKAAGTRGDHVAVTVTWLTAGAAPLPEALDSVWETVRVMEYVILAIVLVLLAIVAGGWFLFVRPRRGRATDVTAPGQTPPEVTSQAPGAATAGTADTATAGTAETAATTAAPSAQAPAQTPAKAPAGKPPVDIERPPPSAGRLVRLRARLARSQTGIGSALLNLLSREHLDDDTWDEIEEVLITADVGAVVSRQMVDDLRTKVKVLGTRNVDDVKKLLRDELIQQLNPDQDRSLATEPHGGFPAVIMMVGVNGTGKTTTCGKLARNLIGDGHTVLLGAADTFRAAAADQLETWGNRVGARTVRADREGADPASVAFEAVQQGIDDHVDTVLIDTAGRLHTKVGLMDELGKVKRVIEKKTTVDEVLLVLDATTGQNGLRQARVFAEVVNITGIVLTKLDGTAKGGIVISVQRELGVPVKLVGLGEGPDDLAPFDPAAFVDAILG
jgi:fused signal recognition particle receptor